MMNVRSKGKRIHPGLDEHIACFGFTTTAITAFLIESATTVFSETVVQALHAYVDLFLLFDTICRYCQVIESSFIIYHLSYLVIQDQRLVIHWMQLLSIVTSHRHVSLTLSFLRLLTTVTTDMESSLGLMRQYQCVDPLMALLQEGNGVKQYDHNNNNNNNDNDNDNDNDDDDHKDNEEDGDWKLELLSHFVAVLLHFQNDPSRID